MKTKSKRPSAPARRSRDQHRARARLLPPRAWRRYIPRGRALLTPRRRRRPFYSMGFARSAGAQDIICAAGEASGSGVWRRLTRGRAQACVAWRRRAGAGREYRGAPGSARCLRSVPRQERLVSFFTFRAPHRVSATRSRFGQLEAVPGTLEATCAHGSRSPADSVQSRAWLAVATGRCRALAP